MIVKLERIETSSNGMRILEFQSSANEISRSLPENEDLFKTSMNF